MLKTLSIFTVMSNLHPILARKTEDMLDINGDWLGAESYLDRMDIEKALGMSVTEYDELSKMYKSLEILKEVDVFIDCCSIREKALIIKHKLHQ